MKYPVSRRCALGGILGLALATRAQPGLAQAAASYPSRPIRIIVPWAAGGGGDVLVRAIAPSMSQRLGRPVIVDNRPGAIGTIGSLAGARSPADGHTLIYGTADSQSIAPHVLKKPPYDARRDFVAIAPFGFTPLTLVVHQSHPARTFGQLVQMARAGQLSYGSWGQGSSGQITMEALRQATGMNLLHVPYHSTAPLMQAQLSKEVDCAILPTLVAQPHVVAGSVRPLAIVARTRLTSHPDVPTLKELGVDVDMGPWLGLLGPAGLAPEIVAKLNAVVEASLNDPPVAEAMKKMFMVIDRMDPAAYQKFYDSEHERWGRYIRAANISLD